MFGFIVFSPFLLQNIESSGQSESYRYGSTILHRSSMVHSYVPTYILQANITDEPILNNSFTPTIT